MIEPRTKEEARAWARWQKLTPRERRGARRAARAKARRQAAPRGFKGIITPAEQSCLALTTLQRLRREAS